MGYFEFTKMILDNTDNCMLLIDDKGIVQYANTPFLNFTGGSKEDYFGCSFDGLCIHNSRENSFSSICEQLENSDSWHGEFDLQTLNNQFEHCPCTILKLKTEPEPSQWYMAVFKLSDTVDTVSEDEITGLPKADIFLDRVNQAIIASRRDNSKIALFLVNLDRFAMINDGLGRDFGDKVLKEISDRLRQSFRESDTISRISGDIFGLLSKITEETHSAIIAEKVLKNISKPITIEDQNIVLTASIGIAICHDVSERAVQIMNFAESAMRHAKEEGGARYYFFVSGLNETAKERIKLENSLRDAVENKEFQLYYQPKVDLTTNLITGAEALIRWNHPKQGMVPPFKFIPVAEETGLIIDIGRWVLEEACRQNMEWQKKKLPPIRVAVNVSPRQFQYPGFYNDLEAALKQSQLNPEHLELEITESMLMTDIDEVVKKLQRLADTGLSIAIDDFGTGYSNLSYLVRFPISTLKIDRAFIKDVETNASIAALTESIILMSRSLKLKIVAEGAENINHIAFLDGHGCKTVQGFYYSKPLPADEFEKLLKRGRIDVQL